MGKKPVQKLHALTSLRFIAAGAIIAMHCGGHFGLPADMNLGGRAPLYLGVSFFFVLSGFILTYVYPRLESPAAFGRFLWARFARIWPCHVFAFGLMLLAMLAGGASVSVLWRNGRALPTLANLAMVHSWVPVNSYYLASNAPSWSIATEFGFYLAFPILLWRLDRNWPFKLALCLLMAVGLIVYCQRAAIPYEAATGPTANGLLYMHPAARLFEFCLGMVTAMFWRRLSPNIQVGRAVGTLLEVVILAVLATNAYFWMDISNWIVLKTAASPMANIWLPHGVTCVSFAALIFVAALERGLITQTLSWRGFVFLGEISYAAYLVHWPFLSFLYVYRETLARYPNALVLAGYVLAVLGTSTASWYLVEAPARKFLLGLWPKPSSIPSPHYALGSRVRLEQGIEPSARISVTSTAPAADRL
jgi:peptidoglycan/LPS O-acetylase OafA/YrhL